MLLSTKQNTEMYCLYQLTIWLGQQRWPWKLSMEQLSCWCPQFACMFPCS